MSFVPSDPDGALSGCLRLLYHALLLYRRLQGFEWSSESDDALDEELVFKLSYWASLTSADLLFPEGETYLFELDLYTNADGGDDPFMTITVRFQKYRLTPT